MYQECSMDSWPCSQLSLPEWRLPKHWLCLKQPCKRLTIHVWFPGCTYCLSGEEGLEGVDMISLRLGLLCVAVLGRPWGLNRWTCGSACLSPPRLSSPVGIHVFWHLSRGGCSTLVPLLLYHLGHQIRHAVYADACCYGGLST